MNTLLISGNDTHIGKTWICRALANYLSAHNQSVQVVKVVETGITGYQKGDAQTAIEDCSLSAKPSQAYTLYSFEAPLAPVTAARKENVDLNLKTITSKINNLPKT